MEGLRKITKAESEKTFDKKGGTFLSGLSGREASRIFEQKIQEKEHLGKDQLPVHIELYYSRHEDFEDLSKLKKKFIRSDMFLPEIVGWGEALLRGLNDVSLGKRKPERLFTDPDIEFLDKAFNRQVVKMIYGSRKPIRLIDLSDRDPLFREVVSFHATPLVSINHDHGSFEETLESLASQLTYYADILKRREAVIIERLGEAVENVLREKPELRKKENIVVLLQMGAAHSNVARDLAQKGWDVQRTFQPFPYIFPQESEIIRRAYFQKEIPNELLARFLIGLTIRSDLEKRFSSLTDVLAAERLIVSHYTFGEIKRMYRDWRTKYPEKTSLPNEMFDAVVRTSLKEKNIKLPSTAKEMHALLDKKFGE